MVCTDHHLKIRCHSHQFQRASWCARCRTLTLSRTTILMSPQDKHFQRMTRMLSLVLSISLSTATTNTQGVVTTAIRKAMKEWMTISVRSVLSLADTAVEPEEKATKTTRENMKMRQKADTQEVVVINVILEEDSKGAMVHADMEGHQECHVKAVVVAVAVAVAVVREVGRRLEVNQAKKNTIIVMKRDKKEVPPAEGKSVVDFVCVMVGLSQLEIYEGKEKEEKRICARTC